ncbi:hypothetical protein B484DRAFT_400754 [Ochromonadaceae sp. CCMP2298]|nr:hypothetical protein B484DRAFT_400754 [Ochromonadaceae sp. CCMP2298]
MLKALSLRSVGVLSSSAFLNHNLSKRAHTHAACDARPTPIKTAFKPSALQMSTQSASTQPAEMGMAGVVNPLLQKGGTPLFSQIQSIHVLPAVEADLARLKKDFTRKL